MKRNELLNAIENALQVTENYYKDKSYAEKLKEVYIFFMGSLESSIKNDIGIDTSFISDRLRNLIFN